MEQKKPPNKYSDCFWASALLGVFLTQVNYASADPIGETFDLMVDKYDGFEFQDEGTIFRGPTFEIDGKVSVQIGDRTYAAIVQDDREVQKLIAVCDDYMMIGSGAPSNKCFVSFNAQYTFPFEEYSNSFVGQGSMYVELQIWEINFKKK